MLYLYAQTRYILSLWWNTMTMKPYRREGLGVLLFQKNKLISTGVRVHIFNKYEETANDNSYELIKSRQLLLTRAQTSESHFIECSRNLLTIIWE